MSNFEGEAFMSQSDIDDEQARIAEIARGLLGKDSLGFFGPGSESEAAQADDYANETYIKPPTDESYCMDDRFEGFGVQLPGNRAISEMAAYYMDADQDAIKLSELTRQKVSELMVMGREPVFHGDEASGKKGCAANLNLRTALAYNTENSDHVSNMVRDRLRMLGIDRIEKAEISNMIRTGGERAADDSLWDVDAEGVVEIAIANNARYIEFKGAHHTAGPREDMSARTFDNGAFRAEHKTDDGNPLGALSLTYGAYAEQLKDDGFSEDAAAKRVASVLLYSMAILKLATKDAAVDVIVGYGVVD